MEGGHSAAPLAPKTSLQSLLNGDKEQLEIVRKDFSTQGWSIVQLARDASENASSSSSLVQLAHDTMNGISAYLTQTDAGQKRTAMGQRTMGYYGVSHKEGYRLLTGGYYRPQDTPQDLRSNVTKLTYDMDILMYKLVQAMADYWDPEALAKCDLPLLRQPPSEHQRTEAAIPGDNDRISLPFGMLDAAFYLNRKTIGLVDDTGVPLNCVAHYDPGLITLAFASTQPGLELFHPPTGEWVAAPWRHDSAAANIGVLWTGYAATKASKQRMVPGFHRVVYPTVLPFRNTPRLALWYEICTESQVPKGVEQAEDPVNVYHNSADIVKFILNGDEPDTLKPLVISSGALKSKSAPRFSKESKSGMSRSKSRAPKPSLSLSPARSTEKSLGMAMSKSIRLPPSLPAPSVKANSNKRNNKNSNVVNVSSPPSTEATLGISQSKRRPSINKRNAA